MLTKPAAKRRCSACVAASQAAEAAKAEQKKASGAGKAAPGGKAGAFIAAMNETAEEAQTITG